MAEVASTVDEAVAMFLSTADNAVAEVASTANKFVAKGASTADKAVARRARPLERADLSQEKVNADKIEPTEVAGRDCAVRDE